MLLAHTHLRSLATTSPITMDSAVAENSSGYALRHLAMIFSSKLIGHYDTVHMQGTKNDPECRRDRNYAAKIVQSSTQSFIFAR